jgi:hypothetical protein
MYGFHSSDLEKNTDPHYKINMDINDLTIENYNYIAGDVATILYAFMVLFMGSATDLMNRKLVLCTSAFAWTLCTYLTSFCTTYR